MSSADCAPTISAAVATGRCSMVAFAHAGSGTRPLLRHEHIGADLGGERVHPQRAEKVAVGILEVAHVPETIVLGLVRGPAEAMAFSRISSSGSGESRMNPVWVQRAVRESAGMRAPQHAGK